MVKHRPFGYIRVLPSGKCQASYLGNDGRRYNAPRTFVTKTEARNFLRTQEAMIQLGHWISPTEQIKDTSDTTFREFCERHITLQTTNSGELLKPSTKELYRRLLRHNLSYFHNINVEEITSPQVAEWWAHSISTGKQTSSSKAYKLLKSALRRALAEGLITKDPCQVRGAEKASSGWAIEVPSPTEVQLIAKNMNPRYREMVLIAAYSGLRFGELIALEAKDFIREGSPESFYYSIKVTKSAILVGDSVQKGTPKSKYGVRTVPLPQHLNETIERVLERVAKNQHSLVFPSKSGGYLRHDVFTNSWKRALKNAGISKRITPHCLRHFAGTELARAGANIAELKSWLGDGSTQALLGYIHATGRTDSLVNKMRVSPKPDDFDTPNTN